MRNPENNQLVNLTLLPEKIMKQILSKHISGYIREK